MSDKLLHVIVQGTLAVLLVFSVATWALVLVKGVQAFRVSRENARFRSAGSKGKFGLPPLGELASYQGPVARVAIAGVVAWKEAKELLVEKAGVAQEILELRLRQQIQRERRASENGLAILASIGTTSPFVGLFGTVWGIMGALLQIGATGSASLDVVAGPIGEALIATGIGIAVAVPAVLAFNFFVRRLKVQGADLEDFSHSLVALALSGRLTTDPQSTQGEQLAESASVVRRNPDVATRSESALREARI